MKSAFGFQGQVSFKVVWLCELGAIFFPFFPFYFIFPLFSEPATFDVLSIGLLITFEDESCFCVLCFLELELKLELELELELEWDWGFGERQEVL